ncbi:MAG: fused MFS/spermidine synthase [Candidatus Eisenbacteria bacterium]
MRPRPPVIASLLFLSGASALVYQTVWFRELRLVFGTSTPASSTVLAIFMAGLGFGGLVLGGRVDRSRNPLKFYGRLEAGIAILAVLTPLLLWAVSWVYWRAGGSALLGAPAATSIRVVLSFLVLGLPTFLMGGTLPAAARSVEVREDRRRRRTALLYGANTLGGVAGVLLPTFWLFEWIGIRGTLWSAGLLNGLVALAALRYASLMAPAPAGEKVVEEGCPAAVEGEGEDVLPPAGLVLIAAAVVGFAFLSMELVWYRMLVPLLGGTTYTFGLVLAVVLLGIGAGGASYSLAGRRRPATLAALAVTAGLEALCVSIPFALGDRTAIVAALFGTSGEAGFGLRVVLWGAIASWVILPAALVSGFQFPLLIGLLGRGRERVGRHVGLGYAWNTMGAIAGALGTGFLLLPRLTAPGVWRMVVLLLALLAFGAAWASLRGRRRPVIPVLIAVLFAATALAGIARTGPTAAWRQAPIGAGRASISDPSPNGVERWVRAHRRGVIWEAEGRESNVAMESSNGLAFLLNGKTDGNARLDAATQVMYGMVGAILHPEPRRALVIGLGTGSTAGWLASIPSMERVDVAEIEPAILEVARACGPVNRNAMDNPRVRIFTGDAREMVLVSRERYDLIASEPSNPYRAGIASLFTREFYRAAADRLDEDGLFLQWVQAYEVDAATIRTIMATLSSAFPHVETWRTNVTDLLFVCGKKPVEYDTAALRRRVAADPFASALAAAWRVDDLEGFLARFVASSDLTRTVAHWEGGRVNTDDRPLVEFGFARTVGRSGLFRIDELRETAVRRRNDRPERLAGTVRWDRMEDERAALYTQQDFYPPMPPSPDEERRRRISAETSYLSGDGGAALAAWPFGGRPPEGMTEIAVVADLLAEAGSEEALPLIGRVGTWSAAEAELIRARLLLARGDAARAAAALEGAFRECRKDPWPWPRLVRGGLDLVAEIAARDPRGGVRLYEALSEPFAVYLLDEARLAALVAAGRVLGGEPHARAIERWEPDVPWDGPFLVERAEAYGRVGHRLASRAARERDEYYRREPLPFDTEVGGQGAGVRGALRSGSPPSEGRERASSRGARGG